MICITVPLSSFITLSFEECVRQAYIMVIFASGAEVSFPAGTKYIERRTYATTIPAREEVNLPITTKYGNIRNTQT